MSEKHIIVGDDFERTIFANLGQIAYTLLKVYENKVLQVDAETGEEQTAADLLHRAVHLAKWLQYRGIQIGDAVSIFSENRLEYSVYTFACFLMGAVVAPLNPDYTTGELQHVINLSKPKIVFSSPEVIGKLQQILPQNSYVTQIVEFGSGLTNNKQIIKYRTIMEDISKTDVESFQPVSLESEELVAAILTSSGTTGLPKGVMITHNNITSLMDIARGMVNNFNLGSVTEGTTMTVTPLFHSFAFMTMVLNIIRGMKVILLRKFNLKLFLESVEKYKVTFLSVPPPILLLIVKHPLAKRYDLSSIEDIRCGAAPLGKNLEEEVNNKFKITVKQAYGMTETTLGVLSLRPDDNKLGSVGKLMAGMMCKVIDENGKILGPYEEGELCFKGPVIMKGYVGDEASTAAAIDKEQWLHTGDVGYYDKDRYFFIVDRLKELIKYNAFQVAPAELEAILISHEAIADAAVIGLPDEAAGELPLAFVNRKPGSNVTESEIEKFIASKVSPQKRLRGGVIFINEIPRNTTGKILRRVLKDRAMKIKAKL